MIVLDTTILVYAVGEEHPLRGPCRLVVEAIGNGDLVASTTVEVLQEFAHVRARRQGREDAIQTARAFGRLLAPVIGPDDDDLARGLDLFGDVEGLGASDAVLAATVTGAEHLKGLMSADRAFGAVEGLVHHDPGDPGFLDSLGVASL